MCAIVVVPFISRMPLQLYDLPFDMLEMIGQSYDELAQRDAASTLQATLKRHMVTRSESACVGHAVKANLCLAAVTLAGTASRALGTTIFFFLIAGFTTFDPVLVFHMAVFADTLFTVLAREELLTLSLIHI